MRRHKKCSVFYSVFNKSSGNVGGSLTQIGHVEKLYLEGDRSLPPLDQSAEDLARTLGRQWEREEEQRRVTNPEPLTIRGHWGRDGLTDHSENIWGSPAGPDPDPLPPTGELSEISRIFNETEHKRLVVLGRSGSGKSVLAMRFALALLNARDAPGDIVPVIFNLGSWDPAVDPSDWLISQLERDGAKLAAELIAEKRVLPILDGFDEMSDSLHGPALQALSERNRMPLLLTSRTAEYAAAVEEAGALTGAAVIQLMDLGLKDLERYLPRTARKTASGNPGGSSARARARATGTIAPTPWHPVLRTLRDKPGDPAGARLATVLKTPLMVMLARTVYDKSTNRDPKALLDGSFSTVEALENHLLDEFVPAVYQDVPAAHRERVRRWLGHLAHHMSGLDKPRDLAWWQLAGAVGRTSRPWVIGLATGLVVGLVDTLAIWLAVLTVWHTGQGLVDALGIGLLNGVAFGSASGLAFGLTYRIRHGDTVCEPSRRRVRLPRGTRAAGARMPPRMFTPRMFTSRMITGLAAGFGFGFLGWFLDQLLLGAVEGYKYGFTAYLEYGLWAGLTGGTVYGVSAALVFTLMAWLEEPVDFETAVSPSALRDTNRANVLYQLLVCLLVCGAMGGALYGTGLGRAVDWFLYAAVGGLGGGLAYGLGLTAWGHWVVLCRVWLPLTGQLPWRPSVFLRDAHKRGVLRQSGAYYQFRHARLQDRLARQWCSELHEAGARPFEDHGTTGSVTA